jgi:CMP-N-acetylneuraminic acid synthetase
MTIEERFLSKIIIDEKTKCWNWNSTLRDGYGRFKAEKKVLTASRFSYEFYKEPILEGNVIMHICDNTLCVNPDHLLQGTHKDNAQDKVNKKRHTFGEKAWQHLLSENEVIEIKKALQNYYYGQVNDLAHFYKVNHRTISSIKRGTTWSHIKI